MIPVMRYINAPLLILLTVAAFAAAQDDPTPGYNNRIPESILTPHDVETRAGTLKYFDGIPTPESMT